MALLANFYKNNDYIISSMAQSGMMINLPELHGDFSVVMLVFQKFAFVAVDEGG